MYARPDHNRCAVVLDALYMVLLKDTGIRQYWCTLHSSDAALWHSNVDWTSQWAALLAGLFVCLQKVNGTLLCLYTLQSSVCCCSASRHVQASGMYAIYKAQQAMGDER